MHIDSSKRGNGCRKTQGKRLLFYTAAVFSLLIFLLAGTVIAPVDVSAAAVRARNTSSVKAGCQVINVSGSFENPDTVSLLKQINAIRCEACTTGAPDPRNPSRKLTKADYVPLVWSTELEKMAQLRAAEAVILWAHSRPNGDSAPWNAAYGTKSNAENLATVGMARTLELCYGEKALWVQTRVNNVSTGHYAAIINPSLRSVALGAFTDILGTTRTSMEFSYYVSTSQAKAGTYGNYIQQVEATNALASQYLAKTASAVKAAAVAEAARPIKEGNYILYSALGNNTVLDISGASTASGANAQLYTANGTHAQVFHVSWNADGTITITNVSSGKALDAKSAGTANGTNVWQYTANGSAAQKWTLQKSSLSGYYTIKSAYTNKALDVNGGSTKNGTNVQLYAPNGTKAQLWKFVPVG